MGHQTSQAPGAIFWHYNFLKTKCYRFGPQTQQKTKPDLKKKRLEDKKKEERRKEKRLTD